MGKVTSKAVFKAYDQQQLLLLPPRLDQDIPANHLVRIVSKVVDGMDLTSIINQYEGGGASAYHPRMLAKVLLYGYAMKIYTGRKLAKALRQDLTFMWLAAGSRPDFRTINLFRSGPLKETIEELFKELLKFLVDHGFVNVENYFTDGTILSADANRHKVVWRKNAQRYKQIAEANCQKLFKEIDALNAVEDIKYGEEDLEEVGSELIDNQTIEKQVQKLNQVIAKTEKKSVASKAKSLKRQVEEQQEKINQYDEQLQISDQRSGYSKTDTEATAMRLKNSEDLVPAYNVMASSENQFITAISVHQNPNDASCFKEHVEQLPLKPSTITADSIFGTEQNYELLERSEIKSFLKFPTFDPQNRSHKKKNKKFQREHFIYNKEKDVYQCPDGRELEFKRTEIIKNKKTGYQSTVSTYQSKSCNQCALAGQCKTSLESNRTLSVNSQLDYYRQQARNNLNSIQGQALRKRRGAEIESCFGDIKHNMEFRRFHLRGKRKVKTELGLVSMAHNLRKIQIQLKLVA